jgi:hypothetical protein
MQVQGLAVAEIIDNDFHPIDKGTEATNDHWGTQLAGTFSSFPPLKDTAPMKEGETRPKPQPIIKTPLKPS